MNTSPFLLGQSHVSVHVLRVSSPWLGDQMLCDITWCFKVAYDPSSRVNRLSPLVPAVFWLTGTQDGDAAPIFDLDVHDEADLLMVSCWFIKRAAPVSHGFNQKFEPGYTVIAHISNVSNHPWFWAPVVHKKPWFDDPNVHILIKFFKKSLVKPNDAYPNR